MSSDEDLFGEESPEEDFQTFNYRTSKQHDSNSTQLRHQLNENDNLFPAHDNKPFVFYTVHEISQMTAENTPATQHVRTVGICKGRHGESLTVEYVTEHPSRDVDSKVRVNFETPDTLPCLGSTIEMFGRLQFETTTTYAREISFVVWFWRERRGDISAYVSLCLRQRQEFNLAEPCLAHLEKPSM